MQRQLGVNTWVWVSPLRDVGLERLARRAHGIGYELLELPVESPGDWDPARAAETLGELGMGAGRDLIDERACIPPHDSPRHWVDVAVRVALPTVAGPFSSATGRTWRMSPDERFATVETQRGALRPVADYAAERASFSRLSCGITTRPASSTRWIEYSMCSSLCSRQASGWRSTVAHTA